MLIYIVEMGGICAAEGNWCAGHVWSCSEILLMTAAGTRVFLCSCRRRLQLSTNIKWLYEISDPERSMNRDEEQTQ